MYRRVTGAHGSFSLDRNTAGTSNNVTQKAL
nr:MAG TPA: hypothetical protein [Caudoviricetes sp.]